jgi:hypothetical protein
MLKKKIWPTFQRITELLTQKIVTKLSKIWVSDPRSGIRKKPIPDPSVADPGCLSRILIFTHPGSRIQKQQPKREVKKISCHTFLCGHKFHKIVTYFSFEVLKKKICANFQRIIELFTKKTVKKLLKIWSWDPGSEIRDPEKTYSGSRGQKGTGSRIRIRNTAGSRIQGSKGHRIPDPQH